MEHMMPGIYRLRLGEPEQFVPTAFRWKDAIAYGEDLPCPIEGESVTWKQTPGGMQILLPVSGNIFGLGLQLKAFNHTYAKRTLRVNADPVTTSGESHAPVPFFVTTEGYGVFIDTARYASLYTRSAVKGTGRSQYRSLIDSQEALYDGSGNRQCEMVIEIPVAKGVDLYFFAGKDMMDAVQRYNMFSGGGAKPPEWGLGIWYRMYTKSTEEDWIQTARRFQEDGMPVSVLGLEPGWQSHAYPCTFVWDETRAPNHRQTMQTLHDMGYKINAWEHCYTHPNSPLHGPLFPYSGDFEVWGGIVPDFALPQAREIFAAHHAALEFDGYKLDECDGSDHTGGWGFPNSSVFPSGMDGEQMHSMLGILYQQTMLKVCPDTYSSVRASHGLAAPYPFVLYSDLYDHWDFIRGMATAGFSGLLWSPEVRDASSVKDLIRRIQTVIFSPQALINAWFLKNPPWDQIEIDLNRDDVFMENRDEVRQMVQSLFQVREAIRPYLMQLFATYAQTGRPPFYALVLDFPADRETWTIDTQYMMGSRYMFAPLTAQTDERDVYIPQGEWTLHGERVESGWHHYSCALDEYLLFERMDV